MKYTLVFFLLVAMISCIPVKIAPKFKNEDYKIMQAKKFQRKMPRETSFIFKDPKKADEFYHFVNKNYNLNHKNVGLNTAFQLNGNTYY